MLKIILRSWDYFSYEIKISEDWADPLWSGASKLWEICESCSLVWRLREKIQVYWRTQITSRWCTVELSHDLCSPCLPDSNPFLDSSFPLYFPQFCNFQEWAFAPGGWHGPGQDHPGHLHCCLLQGGMALAGGHSFFCEVYVGRGTVSLGMCMGSVKSLCDD